MTQPILRELTHHEYLADRLATDFPDADAETLRDTLSGLTRLDEMLAALTRTYLDDRVLAAALKSRIAEMQGRLQRLEGTAERKRDLIATVMLRADLQKLVEPEFTLSLRQSAASLVVQDEGQIPDAYWKLQPPRLDRQTLLSHLRAGQAVTGASLSNGAPTITVRTK